MEILIKESIDSLREALGYDEWDEGNDDELLFRQGYEATPIVVEDGEFFDIPDNYEGRSLTKPLTLSSRRSSMTFSRSSQSLPLRLEHIAWKEISSFP